MTEQEAKTKKGIINKLPPQEEPVIHYTDTVFIVQKRGKRLSKFGHALKDGYYEYCAKTIEEKLFETLLEKKPINNNR